jgi:hypothetical protein
MWAFQQYAIKASQLMFDTNKKDITRIQPLLLFVVGFIEEYSMENKKKYIQNIFNMTVGTFEIKGKHYDNDEGDIR